MKDYFSIVICAVLTFVLQWGHASAKEFPVTARLFAGAPVTDPEDLNAEMTAEGLKEFGTISMLGVEATYPLVKFLDVGFRYARRSDKQKELPEDPATEDSGEISQDSVSVIARVPFFSGKIIRADVFAAVGGTNTSFKIETATQDGELARKGTDGWFGSLVTTVGGSVAFGYQGFFLVFEGGLETNKVKSLTRTGTVSNNVDTIDLSGTYASIGLMFDGVTARSK